ncbi:MAG: tripartite tricarboxylate transporter substrate-binding protein [Proteobacteria bacterium]|nr:tripartite tricarboxylate transporter substrate-binding protein [Pseudomonadota bacterium]
MIKHTVLGAAFLGAAALFSGSAFADFPEKNINFIIPYAPGGGFDTYVRKIAPLMEKHLPNKVNVIPKNVDGAGGRKALSDLWRAKPNGYNIAIFNMPGMLLDKIIGKKTRYEIDKFVWLSQIAVSPYTLAVNSKGPYTSIEALKAAKGLKYPVASPATTAAVAGKIMAAALGLDVRVLPGYKGSSKTSLSIIRGDTHLSLFASSQYRKYAKGGDLVAVLSLEDKSPFPGVPTVGDIGHPELTALATERIIGTAPGTPRAIARVLEMALIKGGNEPSIQAWAKKGDRSIDPKTAAETSKRVDHLIKFYSKYKSILAAK